MANPEHEAILRQGVEVWNEWRKDNPKITPDFRVANLSEANLEGANFSETILVGADLCGGKTLECSKSDNCSTAVPINAYLRFASLVRI